MALPALRPLRLQHQAGRAAVARCRSSTRARRSTGPTPQTKSSPRSGGCPPMEAAYAPFPAEHRPAAARGVRIARRHAALHAPGRSVRARRQRAPGRRHHADGVGQDALLQPAGSRSDPEEAVGARAVSVSDQGARAGSDGGAARARAKSNRRRRRRGDRRAHLRRRHAAGCAPHHSHARAHRAQQSRHGALGHPAAPSAMGEAVREPRVHRHRRAARVSRRVRQPPDQRAAPAAAHLPPLRIESAVHLLVGDDRQSRGARGAARGETVRARSRRAARRGARSFSSSSIRRS